jgi:hypothetical protein
MTLAFCATDPDGEGMITGVRVTSPGNWQDGEYSGDPMV